MLSQELSALIQDMLCFRELYKILVWVVMHMRVSDHELLSGLKMLEET